MNGKLTIVVDGKREYTVIQPGDVLNISGNLMALLRDGKELGIGGIGSSRSVHSMDMHSKQQLICFIADVVSSCTGLCYKMTDPSSEEISATFCR